MTIQFLTSFDMELRMMNLQQNVVKCNSDNRGEVVQLNSMMQTFEPDRVAFAVCFMKSPVLYLDFLGKSLHL